MPFKIISTIWSTPGHTPESCSSILKSTASPSLRTSRKDYDTLYSPQGPGYPGLPVPTAARRQRFLLWLSVAVFVVVPLVPIAILLWYILCQSSYAVHGMRLSTGGRATTILLLTQYTSKSCSLLIPSVMASQAWVAAASWSRGQHGRMQHEKPTPLQYVFRLLKRLCQMSKLMLEASYNFIRLGQAMSVIGSGSLLALVGALRSQKSRAQSRNHLLRRPSFLARASLLLGLLVILDIGISTIDAALHATISAKTVLLPIGTPATSMPAYMAGRSINQTQCQFWSQTHVMTDEASASCGLITLVFVKASAQKFL